jgi:hypothetical protein
MPCLRAAIKCWGTLPYLTAALLRSTSDGSRAAPRMCSMHLPSSCQAPALCRCSAPAPRRAAPRWRPRKRPFWSAAVLAAGVRLRLRLRLSRGRAYSGHCSLWSCAACGPEGRVISVLMRQFFLLFSVGKWSDWSPGMQAAQEKKWNCSFIHHLCTFIHSMVYCN